MKNTSNDAFAADAQVAHSSTTATIDNQTTSTSTTQSQIASIDRSIPVDITSLKAELEELKAEVRGFQTLRDKWMVDFGLTDQDLGRTTEPPAPVAMQESGSFLPVRPRSGLLPATSLERTDKGSSTQVQAYLSSAPSVQLGGKRPNDHIDREKITVLIRDFCDWQQKVSKRIGLYDDKLQRASNLPGAKSREPDDSRDNQHQVRLCSRVTQPATDSLSAPNFNSSASVVADTGETSPPSPSDELNLATNGEGTKTGKDATSQVESNIHNSDLDLDSDTWMDDPSFTLANNMLDSVLASFIQDSYDNFTIPMDDMGTSMTRTLESLTQSGELPSIVRLDDPNRKLDVPWDELRQAFQETDVDHHASFFRIEYNREKSERADAGEGWGHLKFASWESFKYPEFPQDISRPTNMQIIDFLDRVVNEPQEPSSGYYGESWNDRYISVPHRGEQLSAGHGKFFDDFRAMFWHLGGRFVGNPLHQEPAAFRTANVQLSGWTLWIIVNVDDNQKLLDFTNDYWPRQEAVPEELSRTTTAPDVIPKECDQSLQHIRLMISPRRLHEEGIGFRIVCAGPGDMVLTKPYEYHAMVNYTSALTISMSFLLPTEPLFPSRLVSCPSCTHYSLDDDCNFRVSYRQPECEPVQNEAAPSVASEQGRAPNKGKRTGKKTAKGKKVAASKVKPKVPTVHSTNGGRAELERITRQIQEIDPNCKIPNKGNKQLRPEIFRLATIIWSRPVLYQFSHLVSSWRDRCSTPEKEPEPDGWYTSEERIGRRLKSLDKALANTKLGQLQVRIEEFHLAKDIKTHIKSLGPDRQRANKDFIKSILKAVGWEKPKFEGHRANGNKWLEYCRHGTGEKEIMRPGLLCLIPLGTIDDFGVSHTDYLEPENAGKAHGIITLLEDHYTTALCKAGETFLKFMDAGKRPKSYTGLGGEGGMDDLEFLSEDQIIRGLLMFWHEKQHLG